MSSQDFHKLELIMQMIGHLRRRLQSISLRAFLADIDEIDLTAVIGELTSKLSAALKSRHPHIDWPSIYAMRNIIVHDYGAIEPERLWAVFAKDIATLAEVCGKELGG
jgi:uncharacterized protein with HEPN domain